MGTASPGAMEAVEEIARVYRSLPPRPSVEEVEAAMAVIRTADAEEGSRIEEIGEIRKPPDVPEELFSLLQEVRKNQVMMQFQQQRKEAILVVELDDRFRVFDGLIQRASELVSGDQDGIEGGAEKEVEVGFDVAVPGIGASLSWAKKDEKEGGADASSYRLQYSSNSGVCTANGGTNLSLIQVASLIESSAKRRIKIIDLQGKLMDRIEWLPTSLGKLQDVTELNFSENRIMALPTSIASLKCLRKLDIHSNQLINLPDSFGELSNLVELDLHANRLKSLPSTFGNLTSLADLDLSSNHFALLPDLLGNLTSLRRLNMETNDLEELPYTIGSCTSLVELRLDFNQLKALPEAIGKLQSLEVLTLHYNRVKSLPTTMSSLLKLKELDVSFNELESIPENLCLVTSLMRLDVGRNFADLMALPRSIGNLEMLEELDISSNQIKVLPDSFRFLAKLRVFNAEETPLEVPPRDVAKLGAQAVVRYMADLVSTRMEFVQQVRPKGFWFWLCSLCATSQEE
ncbi:plant intracellular Ras-group-related LRR protein 5 [Canna indica]|uniref:Plant intracellular Ras-group-related LRR protein 5 n=1 Tax=Canna indica TaxID=4628 RepID=A0AAQ3KCP8_9LILI|nr:plant intracellular Ras-group-related LRR protein 5 [Canna indica]